MRNFQVLLISIFLSIVFLSSSCNEYERNRKQRRLAELEEKEINDEIASKTADSIYAAKKKQQEVSTIYYVLNSLSLEIEENLNKKSELIASQDYKDALHRYAKAWEFIQKGQESNIDSLVNLANKVEGIQKRLQAKQYPHLRKSYVNIAKDRLWEHNVTVDISGSKNNTITFVAAVFIDNGNIKTINSNNWRTLSALRFKEVHYKAYKSQSPSTYYAIGPKKDDEPILQYEIE